MAQSWKPCMRPLASPLGISWWMIPLPAVIHWTSPGVMIAPVPHAVAVLDAPLEDVGDRLDPPVRVPGEALEVVGGVVRAEIVEEEEGVEEGGLLVAEAPASGGRPLLRSSAWNATLSGSS